MTSVEPNMMMYSECKCKMNWKKKKIITWPKIGRCGILKFNLDSSLKMNYQSCKILHDWSCTDFCHSCIDDGGVNLLRKVLLKTSQTVSVGWRSGRFLLPEPLFHKVSLMSPLTLSSWAKESKDRETWPTEATPDQHCSHRLGCTMGVAVHPPLL